MDRVKLTMAIAFFAAAAFLLPARTAALVPYNPSSILDLMLPSEDPFKIFEQSPLTLARADWRETPAEHQITLDIPGMKRDEIKIEVEENRVVRVSGERKTEEEVKDERWHRVERSVGKFWRQFKLPANADVEKVSARLEDGVLRISVPKLKEQEVKKEPKVIGIAAEEAPNLTTKTEL